MKKHGIMLAASAAALISALAAPSVFAESPDASKERPFIQVYKGLSFESEWTDSGDRKLAESLCPQVFLDEETSAAYPGLAKAFDDLNKEKKTAAMATYGELVESATERLAEDPEYDAVFTDSESFSVVRSDKNIVSLLGVDTGYTGGAHGYTVYTGVNFDPSSGKKLELSDLVTDEESFKAFVKDEIYRLYPDVDKDLTEAYFKDTALNDMVWTAGYDGITCYFSAYTLASYAVGAQNILVPYEGNDSMIAKAASDVPGSYGVEFPLSTPTKLGGREICVYGESSENGGYDSLSIMIDGEESRFDDIYAYSIQPTYFKANGEEYLYLLYSLDNDYEDFDIYRLGEKNAEQIGTVSLSPASIFREDPFLSADAALSDPERLPLSMRTSLLGTSSGYRNYRIGADGKPEPTEEYFTFVGERVLTAKEEVPCEEVDRDGKVIGSASIPAGEEVTLFRTDGDSLVDLATKDGRLMRVKVSAEHFPQTIDGKDAMELFDGIIFAG